MAAVEESRSSNQEQRVSSTVTVSSQASTNSAGLSDSGSNPLHGCCNVDLMQERSKWLFRVLMTICYIVPVTLVYVLISFDVTDLFVKKSDLTSVMTHIKFSVEVGVVIHFLQEERKSAVIYTVLNGTEDVVGTFAAVCARTDDALETLNWDEIYESKEEFTGFLDTTRQKITSVSLDILEVITEYASLTARWRNLLYEGVTIYKEDDLWLSLVAYQQFVEAKENFAAEAALVTALLSQGEFSVAQYTLFMNRHFAAVSLYTTTTNYRPYVSAIYNEYLQGISISDQELFQTYVNQALVYNESFQGNYYAAAEWLVVSSPYLEIYFDVNNYLADQLQLNVAKQNAVLQNDLVMAVCFLVATAVVCPVAFVIAYILTEKLHTYAHSCWLRQKQIQETRAFLRLSDELLHRMLPRRIAQSLKAGVALQAEMFTDAAIYFSDIVGFTKLAAVQTPMQVVKFLNDLYTLFDERISLYEVYKVETIGDAYMVASGLPTKSTGSRHIDEIAKMSLDILNHVKNFKIEHLDNRSIQLRIGIHSGQVVAGVVGTKMPRYCLFGDTVNIASRMESSGSPNKIHITQEFYLRLMIFPDYEIEMMGDIAIQNIGKLTTYWLVGNKGDDFNTRTISHPKQVNVENENDNKRVAVSLMPLEQNESDFN